MFRSVWLPGMLSCAIVAGNERSEEAKMGGMVPAEVSLGGRGGLRPAVDAPAHLAPRVDDGDLPAAVLEEGDDHDRADDERHDDGHVEGLDVALVLGEVLEDAAGHAGDDAGEDEQR